MANQKDVFLNVIGLSTFASGPQINPAPLAGYPVDTSFNPGAFGLATVLTTPSGAGGTLADNALSGAEFDFDTRFALDTISIGYVADLDDEIFYPIDRVPLDTDGILATFPHAPGAVSFSMVFNGTTFDRERVANVFKTVAATASGNTAVWTPASGKKFRLMGWRLSVAGTLAAAGTQVIQLRDGTTTVIARAGANVVQTLPGNDTQIGEDYGKLGQLSATADNVLNINLGTAMATGAVYIDAWGTEE